MNMNETVSKVTLTKVCTLHPFKGAIDSKSVTLAVKYDGLTVGDVFTKALRQDVISWQNGPGRKGYDKLIDKSTVQVNAKAPGATTVDPEQAMVAKLMTMSSEEQSVYLKGMIDKATPKPDVKLADEPTMTVKKIEPVEPVEDEPKV